MQGSAEGIAGKPGATLITALQLYLSDALCHTT